jgi:hypothetical protein
MRRVIPMMERHGAVKNGGAGCQAGEACNGQGCRHVTGKTARKRKSNPNRQAGVWARRKEQGR